MSAPQFGETSTYKAVGIAHSQGGKGGSTSQEGAGGAGSDSGGGGAGVTDKADDAWKIAKKLELNIGSERLRAKKLIEASKVAEGLEAVAANAVDRKKLMSLDKVVAAERKLQELGYPAKVRPRPFFSMALCL